MDNEVKIIPCLDINDPVKAAQIYCREGADELVLLDTFSTVNDFGELLDWIKLAAQVVAVPFSVGGCIKSIDDMKELFKIGVDKVSVNTLAVKNPEIVREAVSEFGGDKVVVGIDGRKNPADSGLPRLEVVVRCGEEPTGLDIVDWAKKVEEMGAGEILLTSKDTDGMKTGYDLEMQKAVAEAVSIPVIASGGAGKLEHFYDAVTVGKAAAVLANSIFQSGIISIPETKRYLKNRGIPVRF